MVRTRHAIVEQICTKNVSKPEVAELKEFTQQDKDIRLLSYKLLVDKFNTKYSTLNGAQKGLLREYINNVNNTVALKSYIDLEVPKLQSALKIFIPKIGDKVTKIKLTETVSLLDKIKTSKSIKDNHILSMLRYYELVKELKKI